MPKLTNAELLLLDNLIYTKYVKNGRTVEEIVDLAQQDIENGTFKPSCQMSTEEWSTVLNHIENNETLSSYQVSNYVNEDTGMRAACFVDDVSNPTDVNVVFRGTSGDYEWHDNGQGAYVEDTNQQIAAAEYVNNLPSEYGNEIVVTGHSKGGNKAQYVTITTDRIDKCVSYDGQGFGQEFLDKYSDEIAEKSSKITSISAENDYVNCLLQPIAGEKIYIETEKQDFIDYHKPNILLGDDGELRPGNPEPSEVSQLINEYTTYIDQNLKEPEKSYTVDGLIALLEKGEDKESTTQTVISAINAVGHVDDFTISRIKDKYGDAAAYAGVYIAALAMPFVFTDDFIAATGEVAVDLYEGAKIVAKNVCNKIGEGLETAGEWIGNAYDDAKEWVGEAVDDIKDGAKAVGKAIAEGAEEVGETIVDGAKAVGSGIAKGAKAVGDGISNAYEYVTGTGRYNNDLIFVNTEGLREEANKMRNYQQEYTNVMQKITNLIITLKQNNIWDAPATTTFIDNYIELKEVFDKFGRVMTEYSSILEGVSERMQTADNTMSTRFENLSL